VAFPRKIAKSLMHAKGKKSDTSYQHLEDKVAQVWFLNQAISYK